MKQIQYDMWTPYSLGSLYPYNGIVTYQASHVTDWRHDVLILIRIQNI